jgi:hypothetical protein
MVREILEVLEKCPLAQYALGKDLVRVLPATPDGFEVVIEQIWENHYPFNCRLVTSLGF